MTSTAGGIDTSGAFGDGRQYVSSAPSQAAPTAAPGQTPIASSPADAQAQLTTLMADKAFGAKFAAGDAEARARVEALNQAAAKEVGQHAMQTAETQVWPLEFGKDAKPADVTQAQTDISAAVRGMGVDPEMARGFIGQMQRDITSRGGQPMNAQELGRMDAILANRWGNQSAAKIAAAKAALASAGKSAEWLRTAMLNSSPTTAAMVMDALASHGERMGQRR